MEKAKLRGLVAFASLTLLAACSNTGNQAGSPSDSSMITSQSSSMAMESSMSESESMDHGAMVHDQAGELPAGLKEAENPTYKVGDQVILHTDHMPGMDGAKATVVGAYDTTAYEVSYDPTTGGAREENHKWVVQEEIADAGNETLADGTEVTLEANHMEGMKGAKATIDSSEKTTVYMIDYEPTDGGEMIRNHQWVVEDEVSPAE